jgi:alpha-ribazole phosphatase
MEIYLIRHTTPAVDKGICYGWADLDVTNTFEQEANLIKNHLPQTITTVYSSPLQRCSKLAQHLFYSEHISYHHELKEINCGRWEMQAWDDIVKDEIDPWMNDFVNVIIPDGESYVHLFERVTAFFKDIQPANSPIAIVAHGGVLRSILSFITNTPLQDSFGMFKINYGCVVKLVANSAASFTYEVLHNAESEKEKHKPSNL